MNGTNSSSEFKWAGTNSLALTIWATGYWLQHITNCVPAWFDALNCVPAWTRPQAFDCVPAWFDALNCVPAWNRPKAFNCVPAWFDLIQLRASSNIATSDAQLIVRPTKLPILPSKKVRPTKLPISPEYSGSAFLCPPWVFDCVSMYDLMWSLPFQQSSHADLFQFDFWDC